jgi:glycosyltransferase involved in cell wall biosynthesis
MTVQRPLLSFCIPTYNRARELAELLTALIEAAAPFGLPIYVSDNASDYDFPGMITGYQAQYPHLHTRRNDRNLGMGANFIKAVDMADSEYVWLFSDDDRLAEGALDKVLALCAHGRYDLVIPDREYRREDLSYDYGKTVSGLDTPQIIEDPEELLIEACVKHFTFIGCLIFRLSAWRSVECARYVDYLYFPHLSVIAEMARTHPQTILLPDALVFVRGGTYSWERRATMVWYFYLQQCLELVPGYTNAVKRRALWRVWPELSLYPMWLVARHGTRIRNLKEFFSRETLAVYGRMGAWGMLLVNSAAILGTLFIPASLLDWAREALRKQRMRAAPKQVP